MVVGINRLDSRKRVVRLVRALMDRPQVDGALTNQRFPILVIEGFRGTGKTALLSELDSLLDQRVPYARLPDLEAIGRASARQVLSRLAFDLSRSVPLYGTLRFHRFIIGQLVMGLDLDLVERDLARRQVVAALQRLRGVDELMNVLVATAGALLEHVTTVRVPDSLTGYVPQVMERWLAGRVGSRRVMLGSFQDWYGHQDLGLTRDPIDVLVDLNRWARDAGHEGNQQRIDELLMAAFLADLRAGFDTGHRADERSLNAVVLLDNADTSLGRRFLNLLIRTRRQRVTSGAHDNDPLTVVVTSRGGLLSGLPAADQMSATDLSAPSGAASGRASRPGWLRHPLPDLTAEEVGLAILDAALGQGTDPHVTDIVYQLTGGHPGATQLVLETVSVLPPEGQAEPEAILGWNPTSKESPGVESRMLDSLLVDVPDEARRDLEVCAAARVPRDAEFLAAEDDMLTGGEVRYRDVLAPILWPASEAAGPTLLRRLLRRGLAVRDPADPPGWSDVYARLREVRRAEQDEAGELYYALAGGDLGSVTRRLHQRLTELSPGEWLDLLTSVTAAPHQRRRSKALYDEVDAVVRAADLESSLTSLGRLITALWIASDPFSGCHRHSLHLQIAEDYRDVARGRRPGLGEILRDAAERHRTQARDWC